MPFEILKQWIEEEKSLGAPNPQHAVLSTVSLDGHSAHGRIVSIREFNQNGFLFFTQNCTKKVGEMKQNSSATMTFWLELKLRQIVIEGVIEALSQAENELYWKSYPREAQIRFCAYAPTSSQLISSKDNLESKRKSINESFKDKEIPISPEYCGFRLKANKFTFYEYRSPELSDVCEYSYLNETWNKKLISP